MYMCVCLSCYAGKVHNVASHLSFGRMCNLPALFCLSEIESGSQADDTVMPTLPSGTIRVAAIVPPLSLPFSSSSFLVLFYAVGQKLICLSRCSRTLLPQNDVIDRRAVY